MKDMKDKSNGTTKHPISRRDFLRRSAGTAVGLSVLSGLPLIGCGGQTAPAAPTPSPSTSPGPKASAPAASSAAPQVDEAARTAKLVEGAKAEGKVVWYTEVSGDDQKALTDAFQKKYPFLQVEAWRGSNEACRDKFVAEFKAGKNAVDVTAGWHDTYITDGMAKKWDNPAASAFQKGLFHPDGYFYMAVLYLMVPSYNTDLVKPADAPKSWDDLLDPKWKGKIAIEQDTTVWFTDILLDRGREKGLEYMRQLAKLQPATRKGHTDLGNLLAAGEYHVVVELYNYYIEQLKEKGAPVEWVQGIPIYLGNLGGVTLAAKAPHPNAGQLFGEWLTSVEGQSVIRDQGRIPARFTDVKPKNPATVKDVRSFGTTPGFLDEVQKNEDLFHELFWPKS